MSRNYQSSATRASNEVRRPPSAARPAASRSPEVYDEAYDEEYDEAPPVPNRNTPIIVGDCGWRARWSPCCWS